MINAGAVVASIIVFVWLYSRKRDAWLAVYVALLLATVVSGSILEDLSSIAFFGKTGLAVALAVVSAWSVLKSRNTLRTLESGPSGALLVSIVGMALLPIAALASLAGAANAVISLLQTVSLACLSIVFVCSVMGRWRDANVVRSDLLAAFIVLHSAALIGLLVWPIFPDLVVENGRLTGVFNNANSAGLAVGLSSTIAFVLAKDSNSFWYRGAYLTALIYVLFGQSRTTAISLVLMILLWMAYKLAKGSATNQLILLGLGIAAAAFLVFGPASARVSGGIFDRISGVGGTDGDGSLLSGRLEIWMAAISAWRERPLLGYGYGNAPWLVGDIPEIEGEAALGAGLRGVTANSYLQILVELGLIGAICLALVLGGLMWRLISLMIKHGDYRLAAPVIVGLQVQFTESPLFGTGSFYPWVFWLCAGAVLASPRVAGCPAPLEKVRGL